MAALQQLLAPQVLTQVISQVAASSDWLINLFGVQPGGANIMNFGHGRNGAYHVYDHVRKVAKGRAPGTAAGRRAANPMGRVDFTYPRMHDSVDLLAENLHNLGRIDDPAVRDTAGATMIQRQTDTLGELAANWRKAQLVGLLRDSLYINFDGDDEYITWATGSDPNVRYNGRMPAGNKSQLDMLGAGNIINASWATATTDIPGHIGLINAAFQQLCGGHLSAIIVGTKVWNYVINNDHVAAIHGSANAPFKVLERESLDPMIANTMKNVYRAVLNVYPDITWYITDEGLDIGAPGAETYSKIVGANDAIFLGLNPGDKAIGCYEGSEPIAEYDGGPEAVKVGLNAWSVKRANPTTTDLFVLDNALLVNHVPNSTAYGTVVY